MVWPWDMYWALYNGKVKYMVNDLLMNLQGLAPLCIPINKTGKQAKDFPRMVEAGFASDDQLIMFPAGLCSRRQNGVIRDLDWKKTFIVRACRHIVMLSLFISRAGIRTFL